MWIMADMVELFPDLMASGIILVTKPFSLFTFTCMFGLKTTFIVIHTWIELVRAIVSFHVNILWRILILTVALISLPMRVMTALQKERLLEVHLHEMQIVVENLLWDRKELEERLQKAIKERRIMESMVAELDEEHDRAIAKFELLEVELQDLKDENLRLKEILGKGLLSFRGQEDMGIGQNTGRADKYGISYEMASWKSSYSGVAIQDQDLLLQRDSWVEESRSKDELLDVLKTISNSSGPIHQSTPGMISKNSDMNEFLDQQRGVALSQSLFSAIMSLLVGMIIWEAEDPCIPLVMSLFTVVGMSLKSVVQFFSTIKNKPASDAVALLSFNLFMLGALTYPTLPRVVHMLGPMALSFVNRTVSWTGLSSI